MYNLMIKELNDYENLIKSETDKKKKEIYQEMKEIVLKELKEKGAEK